MENETTNIENMTEMDMFNAMVKQLQSTMDPRDFMTPTQREIANMTMEELKEEYDLVAAKQSNRGRMQRDLIVSRWEYEQAKETSEETTQE